MRRRQVVSTGERLSTISICAMVFCLLVCGVIVAADLNEKTNDGEATATETARETEAASTAAVEPKFEVTRVQGQVVWFAEALQSELGIESVPESGDRVLAIKTTDGRIYPLIEDVRGRAFRIDKRLREMQVELLVRKYEATPAIQILRVYEIDGEGKKFQVDYWCDICSITMYEDGPCACCQAENRLRRRPVDRDADRP